MPYPGRSIPLKLNKLTLFFQINTLMKIAGQEREYWIPVLFVRNGTTLSFSGNLPINILDFSLQPPTKLFGLVQVYPTISIDFSIEVSLI